MPASSAHVAHRRSSSRRSAPQRPKAQQSAKVQREAVARTAKASAAATAVGAGAVAISRATAWVGAVAAGLTLIWTLWFVPAFAMWVTRLPAWAGIEASAAAFDPGSFLAWVIPSVLLPPTLVALAAVIDLGAAARRRAWSRLGLVFALLYAAISTTNYWLQYAVVMPALMAREFTGLSWLVLGNPLSVAGALQGLGFGAVGLAALFAGLSFAAGGDRQASALRWLLIANGVGGLVGFFVAAAGYTTLTPFALWVWCVTLLVAMALLTLRYARLAQAGERP